MGEANLVVHGYMEATHELFSTLLQPVIDRVAELDDLDQELGQLLELREQARASELRRSMVLMLPVAQASVVSRHSPLSSTARGCKV